MEKENKGSKKKVIIAIAVILLLAVIGVMGAVIYKLMNKKEAPRESGFRRVSGGWKRDRPEGGGRKVYDGYEYDLDVSVWQQDF
ncbi:MAG: hypothetical protein HFG72_06915 [Hungatella sp.]|nr:hypothetical protein [Hungatella sp.]